MAFAQADWPRADVAPSAYAYRADRKPQDNPPESYIALMRDAGQPLNKPFDPAGKGTLCSLLWEENRPIESLVLTWPKSARRIPSAQALNVDALVPTSSANSWWNNLTPEPLAEPAVSEDGRTLTYTVSRVTCGLIVKTLTQGVDMPQVHAYEPFRWKPMSLEIEWGFQPGTEGKDYSGRIEGYDAQIAHVQPLAADTQTLATGDHWSSKARSRKRRGIRLDLNYIGHTVWRHVQPWTSQPGDVARSIVTLWTKAGNFSFNPADLEHGPIYAPEYGFFVRRTSPIAPEPAPYPFTTLLATRMQSVTGSSDLKGWGTAATPLVCANPTDHVLDPLGIKMPPGSVAVHPGERDSVVVSWRCPTRGAFSPRLELEHRQAGGIGIQWDLRVESSSGQRLIGQGETDGQIGISHPIAAAPVEMQAGDRFTLVVSNRGDYRCCTTGVQFRVLAKEGEPLWDLANDVAGDLLAANPHPDHAGTPDVWTFGSEMALAAPDAVDRPPIQLASAAKSGTEFLAEWRYRNLETIRQQTRSHPEMTWDAAVQATRGAQLPPTPTPPEGALPHMRIDVPDKRLEDQWNLGAWHLTRHCATNPATGKLWFNDYPYGILAAETYLVLSVLDQMGEHPAAQDGFDQWTMLPLDRDHPVGLFTDGRGALTFATGPPGFGGDMDGIHAFGPGSIGWALLQHYWLTGDDTWLRTNAPRLKASAEWMLRQREVTRAAMPNGSRLWCSGLQPALQVTPDSGGLWMQFYEAEGYYSCYVAGLAEALKSIGDPDAASFAQRAAAYREDLRAAVDRSIALSPVVPVRDGTYHSVIPFACYCRGEAVGAWGWRRDGSGSHVGPLYWDTVQNGASLVWPSGILEPKDMRVQGYLDVLEDRLLLENPYVGDRDWFYKGWQYQGGLERTANLNLVSDDPPVFLRSFLNDYAVDILPANGYVFNEHAVHGPPDKIFEEAAFLERFRDMLVMEDGDRLWITRAIPSAWLTPGNHVKVEDAPTSFGQVSFQLEAETDGSVTANLSLPTRRPPKEVVVRLRVPDGKAIRSVTLNGQPWKAFDPASATVTLTEVTAQVKLIVKYR